MDPLKGITDVKTVVSGTEFSVGGAGVCLPVEKREVRFIEDNGSQVSYCHGRKAQRKRKECMGLESEVLKRTNRFYRFVCA